MILGIAWHVAIGVSGAAVYIASYALLQLGRIEGNERAYPVMNLVAASLVLVSLLYNFNLAAVVIQATWATLSAVGLVRWWSRNRRYEPVPIGSRATSGTAGESPRDDQPGAPLGDVVETVAAGPVPQAAETRLVRLLEPGAGNQDR